MINRLSSRMSGTAVAFLVLVMLGAAALLHPVRADAGDAKQAAVAAMQTWLAEMDAGQYDQSWQDAAASFQGAVTSAKWTAVSNSVRTPLGKCLGRKLASSVEQQDPSATAKGDFVIAQFDSSFENLKYAIETVTFQKAPDGSWKAAGYYIKPGV